jgi:histidinol-phosphate aminotransferase
MGFLDYYRQFEDVDEDELNRERRARREREKALALEQVPDLDLSGTEWPDMPHSEVVNAAIARARGRVNAYPDRHATGIRRALAERHDVEPERIAVGNGAAELMQAAAQALLGRGDELAMPWPSYPLFPLLAARAGARPVPVEMGFPALREAITDRTRMVAICNPNDPTGTYLTAADLGALLSDLPDGVHVLLDECLVDFQDVEPVDACLRLTDAFPNLLVVRTFSKIYGLSGLRAGYAVASSQSGDLLGAVAPVLGVNALTQAAVEHALRISDTEIARRRRSVVEERRRVLDALRELPVDATASQANFVWIAAEGISGLALADALRREGIVVAPGGPLGADDHVRATIRDKRATDRFLSALERAVGR